MKIAVVGSTGRTGLLVLKEGVRRGHAVTAFSRRPQELQGFEGLAGVVGGDGRKLEDIREAVRGQDAVISIVSSENLGPTTVMSDVVAAEVAAMREAGVRRLVAVSVYAIEGRRPWLVINLVRFILRKPYADFGRMERAVAGSGLAWTVVRPPLLKDGPATGTYRKETGREDFRRGPYSISRADLATALLDLAEGTEHQGEVLLVSTAPKRGTRPLGSG